MEVRVCSYREGPIPYPSDTNPGMLINTTSRSWDWKLHLSPFFLGPINLYDGLISLNMENAWQYSKVYQSQVDSEGNPTQAYWDWAKNGFNRAYADRYPMGKGVVPLYSYWDGHKYGYIEARKNIYAPLYCEAVSKTEGYKQLQSYVKNNKGTLWLMDFDGYDHKRLSMTYLDVLNNPQKKMGHAFVLAMMLENERVWEY